MTFDEKPASRGVSIPLAITGVVLVGVLAFGGGVFIGTNNLASSVVPAVAAEALMPVTEPDDVNLDPVWRAWNVIDQNFVPTGALVSGSSTDPTGFEDPEERVWGMIQGMAASLKDPYTVFLPPSDAEIFQDDISGAFEGVGMEIAIRDNILTIVSPLKGTPAFRAGLKSGDLILKIDGESTEGLSIDQAVRRIRGERGTSVELEIARETEPDLLSISVVRDTINIPTLNNELRPDGVYVIELLNFSAVSSGLFRDALRDFINSRSNKLVLDLRGNPGGFLGASVDMASWFLPSGKIIVTEDYGGNDESIVHRSRGYNVFNENLEMVILVDRGSASASEILAGALKHYDVATLMGTNTFGKGSVQELVDITSDTSLKITVARWLAPNNEPIPVDGIAPDIEVTIEQEDIDAGLDPQLDRAVQFLLTGE